MNQALQDIIEHRRTTNVFEPNHTISDEQIEHLVHLATRAPTSFNLQNWRFLVRLNFAHRRASDRSQLTRSPRGLDGHSEDHAGLTRRGLERVVVSPALARTPRNTCLTNLSLNSSVNGEVRNRRR